MSELVGLQQQIAKARAELSNIRKQVETWRRVHSKEVAQIKHLLQKPLRNLPPNPSSDGRVNAGDDRANTNEGDGAMLPIGFIQSMYHEKNGTPRQSGICPQARGSISISKNVFSNPDHSLHGIQAFSHVWLIFVFHRNHSKHVRAKVAPPRLNGGKTGVFSTRCPHRPNPLGLTLAKLEAVEGNTLELSGIDLIDGTPILDIKPYIPKYDSPLTAVVTAVKPDSSHSSQQQPITVENLPVKSTADQASQKIGNVVESGELSAAVSAGDVSCLLSEVTGANGDKETDSGIDNVRCSQAANSNDTRLSNSTSCCDEESGAASNGAIVAGWIDNAPIGQLNVTFTTEALKGLTRFHNDPAAPWSSHKLSYLADSRQLEASIISTLQADPRSSYRRKQCQDRLYYFTLDTAHVTCWFFLNDAQVLRVVPISGVTHSVV